MRTRPGAILSLTVEPVVGRRGIADFIAVPWQVYGDDPQWVPPLKFERREAFSAKHPFFNHARWQPFVAYRNGVPVGRVSAQVDALFQERHDAKGGFFGCFDAIDDPEVSGALLEAAERWLVGNGCERVLGPFSLGINQEVGILVDGFDTPPRFLMPHGRDYYAAALASNGYREAQRMLAYEVPVEFTVPPAMAAIERRASARVKVRSLQRKDLDAELEVMRGLFNDAWQHNWKFVPWTKEEFHAVGREIMLLVPDDFIQIAELDGEPVAFIVLIPNLNEVIADLDGRLLPLGWAKLLWRIKVRYPKSGRVPLMGVRAEHHNTRLGAGLALLCIHSVRDAARRAGLVTTELSWILEDNRGMRSIIESMGGQLSKTYAMFGKSLI